MTNADLIEALQCASHFALYQDCYEKNCYANSGKGLYCNIPKLIEDAADALEAAEKRIADLETALAACRARKGEQLPKEGEWIEANTRPRSAQFVCSVCHRTAYDIQPTRNKAWTKRCRYAYCPNCGARMRTVTDCHTLEDGEHDDKN